MMGDIEDDATFVVHVQPSIHFEFDADSAVQAQADALQSLVELTEGTDLELCQVDEIDVHVDHTSMLDGMFGAEMGVDDDEFGVPPEDTEMDVDMDDDEMTFTNHLFDEEGSDEDDGSDSDESDDEDAAAMTT